MVSKLGKLYTTKRTPIKPIAHSKIARKPKIDIAAIDTLLVAYHKIKAQMAPLELQKQEIHDQLELLFPIQSRTSKEENKYITPFGKLTWIIDKMHRKVDYPLLYDILTEEQYNSVVIETLGDELRVG